jgi:hypothetical protein
VPEEEETEEIVSQETAMVCSEGKSEKSVDIVATNADLLVLLAQVEERDSCRRHRCMGKQASTKVVCHAPGMSFWARDTKMLVSTTC